MNENKQKIVVFMVDRDKNTVISQYSELVEAKDDVQCEYMDDPNAVISFLNETPGSVLMFEIADKLSLGSVVSVLKSSAKLMKDGNIKVAGFNHLNNKNVEKALKKLGCSEILDPLIKPKTLSFKIDFWLKTIKHRIFIPNSEANKSKSSAQNTQKKNENKNIKSGVHYQDELDIENDIWLIRHKNDIKSILGRWLVKLIGPSSSIAKWKQATLDIGDGPKSYWKFEFLRQRDIFLGGDGHWYFEGPKPEFDWKENIWIFSGSNPNLFHVAGEEIVYRFAHSEKSLDIAHNSAVAETKRDMIEDSFDTEYEFSNENEEADKSSESFSKNNGIETNLKGDEYKEDENSDPFEGHSGPSDKIDGHMRGTSQESSDEAAELEGNGSASDRLKKHYDGKSQFAEEASDDLEGEGSKSDRLKKHYDGKSQFQEEASDDLDGNGSKSDRLKKHYDGKVAEKDDDADVLPFPNRKARRAQKERNESYSDDNFASTYNDDFSTNELDEPIAGRSKKEAPKYFRDEVFDIDPELEQELSELTEDAQLKVIIKDANSGVQYIAELIDLFAPEMELSLKSKLDLNAEVECFMLMKYLGQKVSLVLKGEIVESDQFEDEFTYQIILKEFDEDRIDNFMQLNSKRQQNIHKFIDKVKGF